MKKLFSTVSMWSLCVAMSVVALGLTSCKQARTIEEKERAEIVLDNIAQRKSVRHFQADKQVSASDLETLVKAGMAAPTARNSQPWEFYIITSAEVKDKLKAGLPHAQMVEQASAAIVVCGNTEYMLEGEAREYWVQDCSAATQNILLAAEAMGLGAVWTGVYPNRERVKFLQETLSLPSTHLPLCLIPVGYPTGEDQPKDKYKAERIHKL